MQGAMRTDIFNGEQRHFSHEDYIPEDSARNSKKKENKFIIWVSHGLVGTARRNHV